MNNQQRINHRFKVRMVYGVINYCYDNGLRPFVTLPSEGHSDLPQAAKAQPMAMFNLAPSAIRDMHMEDDEMAFKTSFSGKAATVRILPGEITAVGTTDVEGVFVVFEQTKPDDVSDDGTPDPEPEQSAKPPGEPAKRKEKSHLRIV